MKYNKFNNKYRKILAVIGLSVILAGCGNSAGNVSVEPMPSTTVETDSAVEDPEISEPVLEDSDEEPVEEQIDDRFADATMIQTGENEYIIYADCPDNSEAEIIGETANIRNFDEYSIGAESLGISENLTTAIAAYGMQIDSNNVYQINYDAYMDKPYEYIDPRSAFAGADVHSTSVITNNPNQYSGMRTYTIIPNDDILAQTLLRSCLDDTQNVSLALLKYFAGPDAFDQVIDACATATGLTREEICANYDARYVLQYDIEGLVDDSFINGILQYIASDDPIVIKYYDDNGKLARTDTYHIVRI